MKMGLGIGTCLALIAMALGAAPADATTLYSNNFESYNIGVLSEQGWSAESNDLSVDGGPAGTLNATKCGNGAAGAGWSAGSLVLPSALSFTSADKDIVQQVSVYVADGGGFSIMGIVPAGTGTSTSLLGISPTDAQRTYYRLTTGQELQGDALTVGHWYDIRLDMDFSVTGGKAKLSYRDLTLGQTAFTADSGAGMQSIGLGLATDGSGNYVFDRLSLRSSHGNAFADNFSVTSVPEPCTILMVVTGLLGVIVYTWRTRG